MTGTRSFCSDVSAGVGEQLAGSAPEALAWLALEQPGPWGAKAFTASHLDPHLGRALEEVAAAHRVRPVLVRRPGRHAGAAAGGRGTSSSRHVLLAATHPERCWLLEGRLTDPAALLGLDWAALAAGDRDAVVRSLPGLEPAAEPHLLVCTNGGRDVCCAVKGRPVALALHRARPRQVWEVTHTSGHRFAATAVLLPAGTLHGRLDTAGAERLLTAAASGQTVLPGSRGRSTWPGPAQVAEVAVRDAAGVTGLDDLVVVEHTALAAHRWRSTVRHRDGRRWRVEVSSSATDALRSESCGKTALPLRRYAATVQTG